MKILTKHLLVVLVILILLVSALFFVPTDLLIPKHNRQIEWARSSTEAKIWKFEKTGYSFELRRWIEDGQDGGIGMEVDIVCFSWGERNPDGFDRVISGIEVSKRKEVIERLCSTVGRPSQVMRNFVDSRTEATFVELRKCMWK